MYTFNWLVSRKVDLAVFFLPFFFGVLALWLLQQPNTAASVAVFFLVSQFFGVGPLHLGPAWKLLSEPRIYECVVGTGRRRIFALSLLFGILLGVPIAYAFYPAFVLAVFIAFTIHHLTAQNMGILRLYYNHGAEVVPERGLEVATVQWAAWFFSSVFVYRTALLTGLEGLVLLLFAAVSLINCLISSIRYFQDMTAKARSKDLPINRAAILFWCVSLLFLAPLAFWGKSYEEGIMIPLVMHWAQYLGLNWILACRKQKGSVEEHGHTSKLLVYGIGIACLFMTIGCVGALGYEYGAFGQYGKAVYDLVFGVILAFSFVHYLQDAFVWKFSEPVLRQEILAYLKESPSSKSASPVEEPGVCHVR